MLLIHCHICGQTLYFAEVDEPDAKCLSCVFSVVTFSEEDEIGSGSSIRATDEEKANDPTKEE